MQIRNKSYFGKLIKYRGLTYLTTNDNLFRGLEHLAGTSLVSRIDAEQIALVLYHLLHVNVGDSAQACAHLSEGCLSLFPNLHNILYDLGTAVVLRWLPGQVEGGVVHTRHGRGTTRWRWFFYR